MRLKHNYIIALAAIFLGSSAIAVMNRVEADDAPARVNLSDDNAAPAAVPEPPAVDETADVDVAESFEEFVGGSSYGAPNFIIDEAPYVPRVAARFGWWGVNTNGSPAGVGEWQGLDSSSPFWDIDGLSSNGRQTIDFFATGVENDTSQGGLYFYGGPAFSMDVDYNRFLHRFGHDPVGGPALPNGFPPLGGFFDPPLDELPAPVSGYPMYGQDLNLGQDYAIRVQQLKANFKGNLTDNLSWGLNVWGMKKDGMRQANAVSHCYDIRGTNFPPAGNFPNAGNDSCHLVSQGQRIDWVTMEIEPVITARLGWLTLEYSRTMRSFQQDDGLVNYTTTRSPSLGFGSGAMPAYGYVPENYTEIDRLKVSAEITPETDLYVLGQVGNTHNKFRHSDRKFYGGDVRLTNRSIDGLSATAYAKTFTQNNSTDGQALDSRYPAMANVWYEPALPPSALVDRTQSALGMKGRWRPFEDSCGLISRTTITGGYEYRVMDRDNVTYNVGGQDWTQPDTVSNMFFVGLQQDLSRALRSYVRYRFIDTNYPLMGVTPGGADFETGLNTNLPTRENRVEVGGDWSPTDNLMLTASFWIQNNYNHSEYEYFDEQNYPIVLSVWYAPDERWSITGGYATFSNWIDQDITLGGGDPWTTEWDYSGTADVFNLGSSYQLTCRLSLTGGVEYVRSRNFFDQPNAPAGVDYADLPGLSAVAVDTWRLTAGTDYRVTDAVNTFFRYNYYDFQDEATGWNTGQAHMFLLGMSGVY